MSWKPPYVTLTQMHDWLRLNTPDDTVDDAMLTLNISAASRAVDKSAGRQFGKADSAVTRTYPLRWSRTLRAHVADIDDLMDLAGLTVTVDPDGANNTVDSDRYKLRPRNALADIMPYTYIEVRGDVGCRCGFGFGFGGFGFNEQHMHSDLSMSAPWGWDPTWPDAVTEATLLQAARLSVRRDSPYGVAGSPSDGSELRLLARLDPDIEPIIEAYVRIGWTAR